MQIKVIGSIEIGDSLTSYVQENLEKTVTKYFDNAVSAEVHFSKTGQMFKALITVNEGVKGGIVVKSNSEAGDVYAAFNEAEEKAAKQLRRYKRKIKNYRRSGGGLKSVEPSYKNLDAIKYILPISESDFSEDSIEQENQNSLVENKSSLNIISEKNTDIEELSVEEAIMKMDLADLPALAFINKDSKTINFIYYRKDGNISWINTQSNS